MMKHFRPHRFPPLSQAAPAPQHAAQSPAQWQSSVAEGFQQGMDEGYAQGHASGLENGHAQGLAQGQAEGRRQGQAEARQETLQGLEDLAKPIDAVLASLERMHADYQAAQRKEMVELVARVARQVIRCELTLQPVQLLALVDETLAAMPPAREGGVEIYLNPEDLQRIRELDPKRFRKWTLLADGRLESGECRVKAGDHEVDAGCSQRLAACMQQVSTQLLEPAETRELSEAAA